MVRFSWVLLYSSGLIVYVAALLHTYWDWVSQPWGFHADADAAGTYYLFRICFPHVIAFFHTRKVSERDHA